MIGGGGTFVVYDDTIRRSRPLRFDTLTYDTRRHTIKKNHGGGVTSRLWDFGWLFGFYREGGDGIKLRLDGKERFDCGIAAINSARARVLGGNLCNMEDDLEYDLYYY